MNELPAMICNEADDILFEKSVSAGDRFRQWYYPNLPHSYASNGQVEKEIEAAMLRGLSAQEIADELYKAHS